MAPTSQLVKNIVEEVSGSPVGKNWVSRFSRRHRDRLHVSYMQTIESAAVNADNIPRRGCNTRKCGTSEFSTPRL